MPNPSNGEGIVSSWGDYFGIDYLYLGVYPDKEESVGLTDLVTGFRLLGLEPPASVPDDISIEAIGLKLTSYPIVQAMGGEACLPYIDEEAICANLLDSFSESGQWGYLLEAQRRYRWVLDNLPSGVADKLAMAVAAVFNYFSFEQLTAYRIRRGDTFVYEEIAEYLLRRGSDSLLIALLLVELDGIEGPGIITGFRVRQGLWDLADDIRDLEQDRRTIGANILLLAQATLADLAKLAHDLRVQALRLLPGDSPLGEAIEREYQKVRLLL